MVLRKRFSPLPGFGLSLGYTIFYLSVIVLIPLSAVGASLLAAINVVFGLIFAWVLVRYRFPGKGLIDALVDLPFALPTAVAGIALATIYAENGPVGSLLKPYGIEVAYTPKGVLLALVFIGLPFVVRTVQPVLADLEKEVEEAAVVLGASGWQVFRHTTPPNIKWGLLYGVILCNARAMGEFGAVSVVSGHIRSMTNTMPLHVEILYNEYNYAATFAVASLLAIVTLGLKTLGAGN